MSNDATKFYLTRHAMDRLRERFPEQREWLRYFDSITVPAMKVKALYDFMSDAKEERSFLNDTRFMMGLYERYGFDRRYRIFVKDDIILIGIDGENRSVIATVLQKKEHYSNHIKGKRTKFVKKENHGNH